MNKLLNVSSSPHARSSVLTQNLMFDVAIAMVPATVYGVYQFGLKALCILLVTITGAVLSEYVYESLMGKPITIMDGSALVTGMILGLNMPPEIPLCYYCSKADLWRFRAEFYESSLSRKMLSIDFICKPDVRI